MSSRDISTVATYRIDGSTVEFLIPFEYLSRKFVRVTLIGRDRKELVVNRDYRYVSATQIRTTKTWQVSEGYEFIELRRHTSATERIVDFKDGSILRAQDLNISTIQALHIAEEARGLAADTLGVNDDGHLDARGRKIVNVANPDSDRDAVNFRFLDEAEKSVTQTLVEVRRLKQDIDAKHTQVGKDTNEVRQAVVTTSQHKVASGEARDRAETAASQARQSASVATTKANQASQSEQNASTSASQASKSATKAEQEATKAEQAANKAIGGAIPITSLVQETGQSTTLVMSQKSVTEGLKGKLGRTGTQIIEGDLELKDAHRNSALKLFNESDQHASFEVQSPSKNDSFIQLILKDNDQQTVVNRLKFPRVNGTMVTSANILSSWDSKPADYSLYNASYINYLFNRAVPKDNIVQTTGQSDNLIMSQKAVTDALGNKPVWENIYTGVGVAEYRWVPAKMPTGDFEFLVQLSEDTSQGTRFNKTPNKGFIFYDPNKGRFCETFICYGDGGDWGRYGIQVFPSSTNAFLFKAGHLRMTAIWIRRLED
ncbi:hypothetical protein [Pasteurella phage vB_PmuP_PS30]|nr:hypothetical protein [Pasteurella phage vB_PmuP_PS30]